MDYLKCYTNIQDEGQWKTMKLKVRYEPGTFQIQVKLPQLTCQEAISLLHATYVIQVRVSSKPNPTPPFHLMETDSDTNDGNENNVLIHSSFKCTISYSSTGNAIINVVDLTRRGSVSVQ